MLMICYKMPSNRLRVYYENNLPFATDDVQTALTKMAELSQGFCKPQDLVLCDLFRMASVDSVTSGTAGAGTTIFIEHTDGTWSIAGVAVSGVQFNALVRAICNIAPLKYIHAFNPSSETTIHFESI